ncbi:M56 family metallopeptidase [uncultured Gilvimarinus sp.]|uniref:M56 family metallopeptidase n=1 Tax=uncultured Gilvimarinus sp. TaxID=1689143 RepID=UPI0030EDEB83
MIYLLVGITVWLMLLALLRLCTPIIERWLSPLHPTEASLLLWMILVLPLCSALIIALELGSPAWSHWFVSEHCHNLASPDTAGGELGQLLLCGQHAPIAPHVPWLTSLAALAAVLFCGWLLYRLWRSRQTVHSFIALADAHTLPYVYVLPSDEPVAFTLGYWRSRIFISRGLINRCSEHTIRAVVEHEKAHQLRHDNLRLFIAKMAVLPGGWCLSALLSRLELANEQACDWYATRFVAPVEVASSIVTVARLHKHFYESKMPDDASYFCRSHIPERVKALIDSRYPERAGWRRPLLAGTSALLAIALLLDPLHHWIEWWH